MISAVDIAWDAKKVQRVRPERTYRRRERSLSSPQETGVFSFSS
jgi:hypothetical protein